MEMADDYSDLVRLPLMSNKISVTNIAPIRVIALSDDIPSRSICSSKLSLSARSTVSCVDSKTPLVRQKGLSATAILINFVKGMLGPGCLSLPIALKSAGLWMGFVLVFACGLLTNHCMQQLVYCSQHLSRKKGDTHLDYGNVAYESFANSFDWLKPHRRKARWLTNAIIILFQVGVLSVSVVFLSAHLEQLIEDNTSFRATKTEWMLMFWLPLVLINCIRTLGKIAILSIMGNILMIMSLIFVLQYLVRAPHKLDELPWITDFTGVAGACGNIIYAFEGQAMVLPLENKLKHPEDMIGSFGVLSTGMNLVTIAYAAISFYGYLTFGDGVKGSITLNLPNRPEFILVDAFLLIIVYMGFALQEYVIVDMLWSSIEKKWATKTPVSPKYYVLFEYLFRALIVTLAMLIAISVPNLGEIISLVGVTTGMLLAFVLPSTFEIITFLPVYLGDNESRSKICFLLGKNILLIIIGLFCGIAGLYSTVQSMVS